MRKSFLARASALFAAAILSLCAPALAAYPSSTPTTTDFNVGDTLSATCATSVPTSCVAHSVLGSVTNNSGTAIVTIGGTFTGATINAEGGDCRTTYVPLLLLPPGSATAASSSTSTTGTWRVHVQGFKCFQVRVSALGTGSVVAQIHFSAASASDPLDGSGNVKTSVQGSVTVIQPAGSNNHSDIDNFPTNIGTARNSTGTNQWISQCDQWAGINLSAAGDVQEIVAPSGSLKIHICEINFEGNGQTNVSPEYGTGTLCATGQTLITTYYLNTYVGITIPIGNGTLDIPAANAFCLKNSAGVPVGGFITYGVW